MDKKLIDEQKEIFHLVIDDMMIKLGNLKIESAIVLVKQGDHIDMDMRGNDDDLREMIRDLTKHVKELTQQEETRSKEGKPDDLDKVIFPIVMKAVFWLQEICFRKVIIILRKKDRETLRAYRGKVKDLSSMLEFLRREAPQRLLKQEGDD